MLNQKENVDLRKFLPHRKSMLMVDKHLVLTDEVIVTEFKIAATNIFVENNHFQESGLIENIAQTCSIIVGSSYFTDADADGENNSEVIGFISAIKFINIYKLPKINSKLISEGNLKSRFDGDGFSICTMTGKITCKDELLLECELNLFIKRI